MQISSLIKLSLGFGYVIISSGDPLLLIIWYLLTKTKIHYFWIIKVSYPNYTGNQYWPIILFKALSELFGGSENLKAATSGQIFHALTGCNNLSFRIKEDISKNSQMLKFITKN